jgi:hypothetical protein
MISKKEPRDASHNKVDIPLPPMNNPSQPSALNSLIFQTISVGGTEAVSLPTTTPIIASSLMSPMLIYIILTLLILAIIWLVVGKKIWNIWGMNLKNDRYFTHEKYINRPLALLTNTV